MKSLKTQTTLLVACLALLSAVDLLKASYYEPDFFPIGLTGINTTEQDSANCPYGDIEMQDPWTWYRSNGIHSEQALIDTLGVNCIGGQDANARYIGSFDTTVCRNQNNYLYKVCIPSFMDDGDSTNPERIYIIEFVDITELIDSLAAAPDTAN
jgi:hypothetical protein